MQAQLQLINELIQLSESGGVFYHSDDIRRHSFGLDEDGISFSTDKFIENIEKLFKSDNDIIDTYSTEDFQSSFIEFFWSYFSPKIKVTPEICKEFFSSLKILPIQNFDVYRYISGIEFSNSKKPLEMGPFKIYQIPNHNKFVHTGERAFNSKFITELNDGFLIKVSVKSRQIKRAVEKADLLFEKFILTLHFTLGVYGNKYEVGIFDYIGSRKHEVICVGDKGIGTNYSNKTKVNRIPICDSYFVRKELGFDQIWKFLDPQKNTTEFQDRILLAIEWIGQACIEKSPSSAFLKAMISLEILFTTDKGSIISPSILNNISEKIALILGEQSTERIEIERLAKKLYGLRSKITHTGKNDVDTRNLHEIIAMSRSVIIKLLTLKSANKFSRIDDLNDFLREHKYSCASLSKRTSRKKYI